MSLLTSRVRGMKFGASCAAVAAVAASGLVPSTGLAATAHTVQPVAPTYNVTLSSNTKWKRHYTAPATTSGALPAHTWYVATVQGTYSFYAKSDWLHPKKPRPVICGTPQNSALGPVGMDAEFLFARPWTAKACRRYVIPTAWSVFQASTAKKAQYAHPRMFVWTPAPTANHTYSYVLLGRGAPAKFRLLDRFPSDNYGSLSINLRPAVQTDCARYQAFGFRSEAKCMKTLPAAYAAAVRKHHKHS